MASGASITAGVGEFRPMYLTRTPPYDDANLLSRLVFESINRRQQGCCRVKQPGQGWPVCEPQTKNQPGQRTIKGVCPSELATLLNIGGRARSYCAACFEKSVRT